VNRGRGAANAPHHGPEADHVGQPSRAPRPALDGKQHRWTTAARGDQAARLRRQPHASAAAAEPVAPHPSRRGSHGSGAGTCAGDPHGPAISPIVAAALCLKPRRQLAPRQAETVDTLKATSGDFAAMRQLAMRFRGILRGGNAGRLDGWLQDAAQSGIHGMRRYASTLRLDLTAVENAIREPWSNGQVEGQINRLRTPKRAMYGRAGIALLCARMLPLRVIRCGHRKCGNSEIGLNRAYVSIISGEITRFEYSPLPLKEPNRWLNSLGKIWISC
jgi:hypothetical protein